MPLIVETGLGLASAESYASVDQASAYHSARGAAEWDTVEDQEAALRKATDYMVQNYRLSWKGHRVTSEQALDWPRYECYDTDRFLIPSNVVPIEVRNACIELALKVTTEALNPDLTQQILSNSVGPISVTYSAASPQYKRFRAIDMMLRHLLSGNNVTVKVTRS